MKLFFRYGALSRKDNIISMNRFRCGRNHSPIRQAEAYWTALTSRHGIPKRADIDPRGLENILEYTFILERIAPGVARFRLAGNHLCELAGTEVRGMPLTAFFTAPARKDVSCLLERVFGTPAIAEFQLASESRTRQSQLKARMILLPLRSDLGDVSRILGVLVADDTPAKPPRRFTIDTSEVRELGHLRSSHSEERQCTAGFAESGAAFLHRAPHLRLVASQDD